jgi:hypothetical protein
LTGGIRRSTWPLVWDDPQSLGKWSGALASVVGGYRLTPIIGQPRLFEARSNVCIHHLLSWACSHHREGLGALSRAPVARNI